MSDVQVLESRETIDGNKKEVVDIIYNAQTKTKSKVTKKYDYVQKFVLVNKNISERRSLPKFGLCKGLPAGPEASITSVSRDVIEIRCLPPRRQTAEDNIVIEKTEIEKIAENKAINVCSRCNETGHMFLACPKRVLTDKSSEDGMRSDKMASRHNDVSIKISNLSEDISEMDLDKIVTTVCRNAGIDRPTRTTIVRNRLNNVPTGIAYANYNDLAQAEKFVASIDKFKYNSRVLEAEVAGTRSDDRRGGRNERYNIDERAVKFDDFKINERR